MYKQSRHVINYVAIFLSIFFLIGATIAGFGVRTVFQARESGNWPSVQGIILSSKVTSQSSSDGTTYKPEGSAVPVAYDPANPQTSVLEPGVSKRAFIMVAFGAIFAINALMFGLISWLFTP